ncbi:betaine-aldehyde dehydrogenase [Roseovarius sp. M141]|uniref:betaine-aldehyde dehydrogenase n=1 Tax=Roseovarius sp. M141 TaxID=2583806 RepID=UPI0020CCB48C|nr:betaine-aldehyde dehydrogenase [Roseovarius sp. M141]MCQ0091961.1 betaine-aldehyde dehydrogenase [Roseovarius sp. M141]
MSLSLTPQGSHFVDGAYVEDADGAVIDVIFPATGEQMAKLHSATTAIVEAAVESAQRAQRIWAAVSPLERGRVLQRAAQLIRENNEALSELETYDTGKPIQETLVADATSGADSLEFFGGMIAADSGQYIPLGGGDFALTKREPLGVCLGIGAWNYPTQIACWKAAPALAGGNAMIFKPSETTPLCALKIAEIFIEAGAPKGLFNVVQGYGDVGAMLVNHPGIEKVSLTGSVPTGRKVAGAAAAALKHITMELGGKSPILVFEDADIESAIGAAMLGNFYSSGQICSNGTRVFVHEAIHDRFVARLTERTESILIGDPRNPDVQYGPMVTKAQMQIALDYIEIGKAEGATLQTGGVRVSPSDAPDGFFVSPAVFIGVTDDMRIAREEIFGPVMSVLKFASEDEVVARANATEFGLAAGIFTQDITRAHRVIDRLEAGTCWINTYNQTPVQMPFGGVKASGFGRENSAAALDHYTQLKSVYVAAGPVDSPY